MKFIKRLEKREKAIQDWLKKNNAENYLDKIIHSLNNLPKDKILSQYTQGLQKGLQHCVQNDAIKALDYSWYFSTPGEALAYGLDEHKTKGTLSKTDLGPTEVPGIEIKSETGNIIDDYFASLPVHLALSLWTEELSTDVNTAINNNPLPSDVRDLLIDLIQLWNYKVACEACEQLKDNKEVQKLKDRAPFWVTMTRYERWSVPIMLID